MSALPFLALLGVTLAWFALPLLPAIRELLRPTDLAALKVVDRSAGYVAHFARNFRKYLERQVIGLPAEAQVGDFFGRLPDGTPFLRVHKQTGAIEREAREGLQNQLVVIDTPARLAGGETFLMELYARAPLTGGPGAVYRAVYAEQDLTFGDESMVVRWAHAGGALAVGDRSTVRGRLSSDSSVRLGREVVFERIGAPVISAGDPVEPAADLRGPLPSCPLPAEARVVGDHIRITGDFAVSDGTRVEGNLVVAGRLRIGRGAVVDGSVKAHQALELAEGARVLGAAVSRTDVVLGPGSWVRGPAIAEERVLIGNGATVGSVRYPATASAPLIELGSGATVHGQISAMREARTLPA